MGVGVRTELGVELKGLRAGNQLRNLAIRVVEITEIARLRHTVSDAGRSSLPIDAGRQALGQASVDAVPAIVTLQYDALPPFSVTGLLVGRKSLVAKVSALVFHEIAGPIRTGDHAVLATDAFFLVDEDDAILAYLRGFRGADFFAGRFIALHAQQRQIDAGHVRVGSDLR